MIDADKSTEAEDASSEMSLETETLEKESKGQKKFTYHQDSIKRYKKQLSKNNDLMESKIKEELPEEQAVQ